MAESLVDLVLRAPEEQQAQLLAATIAYVGQAFLEKTGAIAGDAIRCNDGRARLLALPVTNGNNGQNVPGRIGQPKSVRFSPGVALGYISGAGLCGRDRLILSSQDTDFLFDRNGAFQPID